MGKARPLELTCVMAAFSPILDLALCTDLCHSDYISDHAAHLFHHRVIISHLSLTSTRHTD